MVALEAKDDVWSDATNQNETFRFCINSNHTACNWLVDPALDQTFCTACRHNGTIPNISDEAALRAWLDLENAKHRLVYSLMRWKLPLKTRGEDPRHGLIFNFLAESPQGPKVLTGHDNGVITIALSEADDLERERRRLNMGEPYRTLLGHFRHEIGHHYWDLLVKDTPKLEQFRQLFGDETADYQSSLQCYYAKGAPRDWQDDHVSAYATMHPWEDFAETWAHYLHIVDTLEMAAEFGLNVQPKLDRIGGLTSAVSSDSYAERDFSVISRTWLPFVFAMNGVSRTMGSRDLYPFVLSTGVLKKMAFIHELIHGVR